MAIDDITFSIINPDVISRLQRDGKIELPAKKVSIPKDERWNEKLMASKILKGLEAGDSIPKISKSLQEVIGNNRASAIRNARTMVTSAENHGRLDSYKNLASQGVVMKKEWEATPDDRTRPSHIDIDGEEQDLDKPFSNGCQFPGDGKGPAEEVWMCRCAMGSHIIGFKRADGSISYVNYQRDEILHDAQIGAEKARRSKAQPKTQKVNLGKTGDVYTDAERAELLRILTGNDSMSKEVYLKYIDQLEEINTQVDAGKSAYFSPSDGQVHLNPRDVASATFREDKNAFDTHFHEYGHNIDWLNGKSWNNAVSVTYRDAKGRTFEEIITNEWSKKFDFSGEAAMWKNFERNLDISSGGMGAEGWARLGLNEWRDKAGLSVSDERFRELRRQLRELTSDDEIRNFIKKNIDIFNNGSYNLSEFDMKAAINDFCKEIKDKYTLKERGDLSDMFERFSVTHGGPEYPFGIGHGAGYAQGEHNLALETFAEMFSAEIAQSESLAVIKEYLPESYQAFQEMIGGLL